MELVVSEEPLVERWQEFLKKYYWDEILKLSNAYPEERSLYVSFFDVIKGATELESLLLEEPDVVLRNAREALRRMDLPTGVSLEDAHVRIVGLPEAHRPRIRDIRSHHIGKLISVEGIVLKVTEVRPKIVSAAFECQQCRHVTFVPQEGRGFVEPAECEGCHRKTLRLVPEKSKFVDAQKMRLQEPPEELRGGEMPQILDVNLEDDIAGVATPGDRVVVTGILRSYQRRTQHGKSPFFDVYLDAISVEREEKEFEEIEISEEDERKILELKSDPNIYEKLIRSIAPSIYGYEEVKEAILLQLFSGIPKELPDGTRIRGDIHVLLVGDPGIAKSQLLSYAVKLAPRGIYAGAKGATAAGLTATAVKDEFGDGRWALEAGVLVLADKGIAAIDEMDKMDKKDRDALHEAMEQQTISIAKAGITATLKARCAILGAANPKYGRFDRYEPLAEQINLPPTLLSRFDLIFTLMDRPEEEADVNLASHILRTHYAGELLATSGGDVKEVRMIEPEIPPSLLRKYIAYARRRVFPVMSREAMQMFLDFYVGLRRQGYGEDAPIPVTARQLEALIRLGEACARARLSNVVTAEDAERVIRLVNYCLRRVFVDPETGKLDVDWVAVGTSKSRRDRAKMIKEIIKELEEEAGGGAVPLEEVLDVAESRGIERAKAEEVIESLKRDGIIYSPKHGYIGIVR